LFAFFKCAEEAIANRDSKSKGSKTSFEASVADSPYYPYDQELFGHDVDDTPDLGDN